MLSKTPNIFLNDVQVALSGLEQLAIIALAVIVTAVLFRRTGIFTKNTKLILWSLIGFWATATILQNAIATYNYTTQVRPLYREQVRQSTGL